MKVFKELPYSIFYTIKYRITSAEKLNSQKKEVVPIIVSFTSIPSRLGIVDLVVKNLLSQSVYPKKILLWLNTEMKNTIPKSLENLQGEYFKIHYTTLKSSHKKLTETLKLYPNETIVTCDDDVFYHRNWLDSLYNEHLLDPDKIIANRTVHINYNADNEPMPSKSWNTPFKNIINPKAILPIGVEGTLYPVNSLSSLATNSELFLKLAPKADDLWFKAMSLLNGTLSKSASNPIKRTIPIIGTQKISLKKENVEMDKNTEQWNALSEYFNLSEVILKKD